jgi:CRP/FNR family transcriptional regulator, cyclic AMP receptor protein
MILTMTDKEVAAPQAAALQQRGKAIEGSSMADLAAQMLHAPGALFQLTPHEARTIVSYMQPHRVPEGTTFIKEGDRAGSDFMMLVLDGEVTVETIVVSRTAPITVSVLGPGSLIGEMGLVDGEPRSASCTAGSRLLCAILTREAMGQLLDDDPRTAAKLILAIAHRIAERMREGSEKLKLYVQLTLAMQEEIEKIMPL